jgi:hypothetical protein
MKIQTNCPQCRRKYSVQSSLLGKKLKCKCGEVFQLQSPTAMDLVEPSQVQQSAGFWDDKFDEIEDALPKEKAVVAQVAKPVKQPASFEAILPMDPFTGGRIYNVVCFAIGLLVLPALSLLLSFVSRPLALLILTLIPIFAVAAFFYRIRAHFVNHIMLSIRDEGISILYQKRLPWPCRDQTIPVESIEEIHVECNTVLSSWLMPRAEYSHTSYSFNQAYTYVFVFDLKCKIKNKHFETRILTVENRDLAKSIRLHLKRMLPESHVGS